MTINTAHCQFERLADERLMTHLIQVAAAARRRPGLKATLRQWHAEELSELKAEMLAASDLDPERIVELAAVSPDAELPARATVTRLAPVL